LVLSSCEKTPMASFSIDSNDPVVGQPISFINSSHHGEKFDWDFGDGYVSNDRSPVHTFTSTGSFKVILTVTSDGGNSDEASLTVNVKIPTLLEIEVREYYSEDVIPDASILLYPTITDWNNQTNSVVEGFTDSDGVAVFSDLDPYVYYVDVWEATHDNYTLANEDVGFIRTPEVLPHKINRFIAWVDIADHSSGINRGTRDFVIRKLERVATDKKQPLSGDGIENWQQIYKRSIKIQPKQTTN